MFKPLKFVLTHKINYSWWLDFYIRWVITYMQTIFAVPRVAWVNLLLLTRVIASWPGFHHLAAWCSIPSWLTFISLPLLSQSYWLHKQMPTQGARVPATEKNRAKENCRACHLLSWQEQDIHFCKDSCSEEPVPQAWQKQRGNKGFMGI